MNIKLFILINSLFNVSAISIKKFKIININLCNCTVSRWYVKQSNNLKKYILNNKEALYM